MYIVHVHVYVHTCMYNFIMYNHVHVCLPGSEEKVKTCKEYGAHLAINYKQQNFATEVLSFTDNKGMVYSTCTGMYTVQIQVYRVSYIVPSAVDEHVHVILCI